MMILLFFFWQNPFTKKKGELCIFHSFPQPFPEQILTKHLVCAEQWETHWGRSDEQSMVADVGEFLSGWEMKMSTDFTTSPG